MPKEHLDCEFHPELIHPSVYIAKTATIVGDVSIGAESSIWFGAIIRADVARVTIGQRSNVQDGAIIHGAHNQEVVIGNNVTMGHGAIVHAAKVGNNVMVATRATVLDGAQIGENSIIGAGAIVTPGTIVPPNSLVLGVPGKVVRQIDRDHVDRIRLTALRYVEFARAYREVEQQKKKTSKSST